MTIDLTELEALLAKATPGPWRWSHESSRSVVRGPGTFETWERGVLDDGSACDEYDRQIDPHGVDAHLIVALRNAVPELIAELKRLREELAAHRGDPEGEVAKFWIEHGYQVAVREHAPGSHLQVHVERLRAALVAAHDLADWASGALTVIEGISADAGRGALSRYVAAEEKALSRTS